MLSTLHCFGVGVVLFLLAPPTTSFSSGASHASCQDMIPGHIRAHSQELQHRYVTVRSSAFSYLPGQFITVTVRSSRDFMGFLLQARSADGTFSKAGGDFGVMLRPKTGAGTGIRKSTRGSPVLVGGSWILTPPGTHTLCCLSEGDTVTHSDKQLKRNLSFVWRAPDSPVGDIRFYITVVQSYFVYWAGIESAMVRDASRSLWSGSNTTGVNRVSAVFALLQDKVTALPALGAFKASNKQTNKTERPTTTLRLPTRTRSGPHNYKSLKTPTEVTHATSERSSSVTLAFLGVNKRENVTLGSLQNDTQAPLGSFSGVSEEAHIDPIVLNKDHKSSSPFTASFSSVEARGMETTTTSLPNITVQASSNHLTFLVPVIPLKEKEDPKLNLPHPKLPTKSDIKDTTTTTTSTKVIPFTSHSFYNIKFPRSTSQNPQRPIQEEKVSAKFETQSGVFKPHGTSLTESQSTPVKADMSNQSHSQTSSPKLLTHFETYTSLLLLWSKTSTGQNYPFPSASSSKSLSHFQTSSPNAIPPSKSLTLQSFLKSHRISSLTHPKNSPTGPKSSPKETSRPFSKLQIIATALSSSPQPEYMSTFGQDLPETTPMQTQAQTSIPRTDSKSEIPPEVSSTPLQPLSQLMLQTGQKRTQSSGTPLNPLLFTPRTDRTPVVDKGKVDLKSEAEIRTMSQIFALVPSATPSPSFSVFTHLDSSFFSSSNSLPTTATVHSKSTNSPYPSGGYALVTMRPSIRSTFYIPSSFSYMRNQPTTSPALSALPAPSPISSPPYLSSSQPTPTSPLPSSFASSTMLSLSSSNYPSSALVFTPAPLSPFTSSQCITNSTNSSISCISSTTSSTSSSANPSFFQDASSSSSRSSVTFLLSAQTTSPHPGPSPAPRRSLYNLSTPSVPSDKLTVGQRLLIQSHTALSDPDPSINPDVHPNPKPHPNIKETLGHELKPNLPNSDTKHPFSPSATPDKKGKYPDIIPRHSAWELGMLLGSSAGLGMVLVVGIRYMYRQACGKRTEVTLNDREREYGRGEIGLIHVQECGDLVRVRKIRENSLVLLAEYDILSPPGERNTGCQQRC